MVPPVAPSWTDQVTAVFEVFAIDTVNGCDCPTVRVVAPGVTLMDTGACDEPHPDIQITGTRNRAVTRAVPRTTNFDKSLFQSLITIRSSPRSMLLHAIRASTDDDLYLLTTCPWTSCSGR